MAASRNPIDSQSVIIGPLSVLNRDDTEIEKDIRELFALNLYRYLTGNITNTMPNDGLNAKLLLCNADMTNHTDIASKELSFNLKISGMECGSEELEEDREFYKEVNNFIFLIYDKESLETVKKLHKDILDLPNKHPKYSFLLVNLLNTDQREGVSHEVAKAAAESMGASYFPCNSLSDELAMKKISEEIFYLSFFTGESLQRKFPFFFNHFADTKKALFFAQQAAHFVRGHAQADSELSKLPLELIEDILLKTITEPGTNLSAALALCRVITHNVLIKTPKEAWERGYFLSRETGIGEPIYPTPSLRG